MHTQNPLDKKLEVIKELKGRLQADIRDEDQAQRTYGEQIDLARKAELRSAESQIRSVKDQESKHAEIFRNTIRDIEREEASIKTRVEAERKKKEEEQRRLAEQQRRELEAQRDRLNKARITEIRRRGSGY